MNEWGNAKDRPPSQDQDPAHLGTQHLGLGVAVAALGAYAVAYLLDHTTNLTVYRGTYGAAIALILAGTSIWLTRSAEARIRQAVRDEVSELHQTLDALRHQVAHSRVTYLPAPRRHGKGQRYIGAVPVDTGDEHMPDRHVGIDPDTIAAARRISERLQQGGTAR
jgi:hypothetical protein